MGDSQDAGNGSVASIDPCKLITVEEGRQFGIIDAEPRNVVNQARACDYSGDDFLIGISVWPNQSLTEYNDVYGKTSPTTVRGKPALEQRSVSGGCVIAIRIADKSRADIGVEFGSTPQEQEQACAMVPKIADIVAPKLEP